MREMPKAKKKEKLVHVSGRHKASVGDKALLIKSHKSGWHYRPLKKRPAK
jgi:hypothetical protein